MRKILIATILIFSPLSALASPPRIPWLDNRKSIQWVILENNQTWSEAVDRTLYPLNNGKHGFIYRREWKHPAHVDYPKYEYYYGEIDCKGVGYGLYGVDYVFSDGRSEWRSRCQEMGCSIMDEPSPNMIDKIDQKLCP
jgi:hypothetical protein